MVNSQKYHEDEAFEFYVSSLTRAMLVPQILDIAKGAWVVWKKATGLSAEISNWTTADITIRLDMGAKMPITGEYPNKEYHLNLVLEHILQHIGPYTSQEDFEISADNQSHDFKIRCSGNFPDLSVYAYHGGNCEYVQTGTETLERPIYEMRCV